MAQWHVKKGTDTEPYRIMDGDGVGIAELSFMNGDEEGTARVIAQAPYLLWVAEELVAEFDADGPRNDTGGIACARQAIELARGS